MKKIIALIVSAALAISLMGCNSNKDITDISFHIPSLPSTIDPQIASTAEEINVVRNVFEGLTRYGKDGEIVLAAAKSYTISSDGLTYIFKLDKNKKWSNSVPLTAHDFVFAMRRAADPATRSPGATKIRAIAGADAILDNNADLESLKVWAVDDYTLVIELKSPCPQFLSYLSEPAFMPCNPDFFHSTNGKYGLGTKTTIYNGPYYVNGWKEDKNYISIKESKTYSGDFSCDFSSVLFVSGNTDKLTTDFNDEKIHIISLESGSNISNFKNYDVLNIESTTCALYISPTLAEGNMLNALKASLNPAEIAEKSGNIKADGYIPGSAIISNTVYNAAGRAVYTHEFKPAEAYDMYIKALKEPVYGGQFPEVSIIYSAEDNMEDIAKQIASAWQSNLGVFVNIKALSRKELYSSLVYSNYNIALLPISAESNSAADYLISLSQIIGLPLPEEFDSIVNSLSFSKDMEEFTQKVIKAEKMAVETKNLVPICHIARKYICNSQINQKLNYINGAFDFAIAQ